MERRKLTFRIKGENTFAPSQIFAVRKGAGPRVGALRSPPGRGPCLCLVSGQAGADTTRVTTPRAWTLWPCGDGHSPVGRENRGDPGSAPAPSHWSCGLVIYPGGGSQGCGPQLGHAESLRTLKARRSRFLTVLFVRNRRGAHGQTWKKERKERSGVFRGGGPSTASPGPGSARDSAGGFAPFLSP